MTETQELEKQSESLVVRAQTCTVITNRAQYVATIELGRALKAMNDGIEQYWEPLINDAFKQHKALVARKKQMTSPVLEAITKLKLMTTVYEDQEERKRKEAERIAAEALRKEQETEALLEAQRLSAAGDQMGAESVLEHAISAPPPPVIIQSTIPQVQGKSSRQNWKYRVTDLSKVPDEYKMLDDAKVGQVVRAMKEKTNIPGIQAYPETVQSFRA